MEEAEKSAIRAAALVKQLLVFSRRSQVERTRVHLQLVVSEIEAMIRDTFDRRITIETQIDKDVEPVLADSDQLHQVLLNLCLNAKDALFLKNDSHDMRITITAERSVIDKKYCSTNVEARPGIYICLCVADNGAGMEPETLNRIFEPFFTTKGAERGTGLGLAIVYGIVKKHQGWIEVQSTPGQGTTFKVFLQVAPPEAARRPAVQDFGHAPRATDHETVLLVDDEAVVRSLGKAILEQLGYTVLLANDGVEGLEVFNREREKIHVSVLDISMPNMPGDELLRHMRDIDPQVKVIVSSGHTFDAPADLTGLYEPSAYLRKPYGYTQMATVVRQVIDMAPATEART